MNEVVLLVEDRADDVLFIQAAFDAFHSGYRLVVLRDGRDAIDYFQGVIPYDDRVRFPLPGLVLLDLHMPDIDGFQVLEWLRKKPELQRIPVVVLTCSSYSPDIHRAYELGANSFLTKSNDGITLSHQLKNALDYWLPQPNTPGPPRGEMDRAAGAEAV